MIHVFCYLTGWTGVTMESVLGYLSDEGYVTSSHSGACAAASGTSNLYWYLL